MNMPILADIQSIRIINEGNDKGGLKYAATKFLNNTPMIVVSKGGDGSREAMRRLREYGLLASLACDLPKSQHETWDRFVNCVCIHQRIPSSFCIPQSLTVVFNRTFNNDFEHAAYLRSVLPFGQGSLTLIYIC